MKIRSPLPQKRARIEIIPLIDIMFFLLASFMMVSLQMQKIQTLRASLPTATVALAGEAPEMLRLRVDPLGRVEVDGERAIGLGELRRLLGERFEGGAQVPVYITGHERTRHGTMIYVLDFVRQAGAENVAFSVDPETTGVPIGSPGGESSRLSDQAGIDEVDVDEAEDNAEDAG